MRISKDPKKFQELTRMIKDKVPYVQIARKFGIDHSSVIHWARKFGIPPVPRIKITKIPKFCVDCRRGIGYLSTRCPSCASKEAASHRKPSTIKEVVIKGLIFIKDPLSGELINQGRSYREYLAIEKQKNKPKSLLQIIKEKAVRL